MFDASIHLAPNAPWLLLAVVSLAFAGLSLWAYRFAIPPLPALAQRMLPALRIAAVAALVWLLAQPVLERPSGGGPRLVVLLDRSRSMDLPASPKGGETRSHVADEVVAELGRAWRGRAAIDVVPFAAHLGSDSAGAGGRASTALGAALAALSRSPLGQRASGVVVVSDGAVNSGEDPVAAARSMGVPVHAVVVGDPGIADRAVTGVESSAQARVGRPSTVRVRVSSTEARGTPIWVKLLDQDRELGRTTVFAPGGGAEVAAEFEVTPLRPGLAVWTARVDSLAGEASGVNNARQLAVEVAPGRLGVLILSSGLNWDLSFIRRALVGDSSVSLSTFVRDRNGWRGLEAGPSPPPGPADLRGQAIVILDALAPIEVGEPLDRELGGFLRSGGAVLALGGPPPGLARYRHGRLGEQIGLTMEARAVPPAAAPDPSPEASELLAWDDDPARGERAWRAAAPLSDLAPIAAGGGDRVLIRAREGGLPILVARRIGRGQALLVNGTGLWRWSLSGHDDLTAERGRRLWRRIIHWLAEPVQGEPLRVRPERWLTTGGESVRLFATLQDEDFRPVAGAHVDGEIRLAAGRTRRIEFAPRAAGTYVSTLEDLPSGRYTVSARATRGGSSAGSATSEFAVDAWSLEEARVLPDSATLAGVASGSGGRVTSASQFPEWARAMETRALARGRTESLRLWESPWVFGAIVGALTLEWAWRRRRGLP